MDIEDPKTSNYVQLLGAVNFEIADLSGHTKEADQFSFRIDWTKGGEGQDILHEHLRSKTPLKVKYHGKEYRGVPVHESGFNTPHGMVAATIID